MSADAARDAEREREFDEMENDPSGWGWDGQHVEDAVAYACMFRRQRDEARTHLAAALADPVEERPRLTRTEEKEVAADIYLAEMKEMRR